MKQHLVTKKVHLNVWIYCSNMNVAYWSYSIQFAMYVHERATEYKGWPKPLFIIAQILVYHMYRVEYSDFNNLVLPHCKPFRVR
jgi:hypothetical protein